MTKLIVGVDISKKTFDVSIAAASGTGPRHKKYSNDLPGFTALTNDLPTGAHLVMEASGCYYLRLAAHLYGCGYDVSVVNPLSMSHFIKMRMHRSKTDKKDAGYIREFGESECKRLRLWKPKPAHLLELQNLSTLVENFTVQRGRLKNIREAFICGGTDGEPLAAVQDELEHLTARIDALEGYMLKLVKEHHGDMLEYLTSIPGVGKKSAMMLIVITEAFSKFSNSKQLAAYVGIDPRVFESGTSVKAKPRIKKMGMGRMRQLLYMCGMKAKTCNKACAEMYTRLVCNGKNGKQAIIAVAHKILRQAFAVATKQKYYQEIPA
jgi:transposase